MNQQPAGETCTVSQNYQSANVTANVAVVCNPQAFAVSGTISNLNSDGLILQLNGTENTPMPVGIPNFGFKSL